MKRILLAALLSSTAGCDGLDDDFFPYALTGLDAYVYNNATDEEYYAGRVEASYLNRERALSECATLAADEAENRRLDDWSYVCCTVTSSSDCVTKVR